MTSKCSYNSDFKWKTNNIDLCVFVCSRMTLPTKRVKQYSSEHLVLWKSLHCRCYPIIEKKCENADYETKKKKKKRRQNQTEGQKRRQ